MKTEIPAQWCRKKERKRKREDKALERNRQNYYLKNLLTEKSKAAK